MKHTGPPHGGGALTTCARCKAYAVEVVKAAIAKRDAKAAAS
jgi:hypothetical protein